MTGVAAVATGSQREHYEALLGALDPDRMQPLLAGEFGDAADQPCVVLDAKYEPGRPATVLYGLGPRLVHATVPPPGWDAHGAHLPNGVTVNAYPVDPGLPTLPAVLDPRVFGPALAGALGTTDSDSGLRSDPDSGPDPDPGAVAADVDLQLVRYRPGRRATFLVTVTGKRSPGTYVAKVYHDGAKAAAVAAEGRALAAGPSQPPLVLAPVVAHLPDLAVVVQGFLDGHGLEVHLDGSGWTGRHETDLARAAEALAVLHGRSVPNGRPRPVERELHRFVGRAGAIRSVDPDTGQALLDGANRLLGLHTDPGPLSLVHGDCKPSQFLVTTDGVAILDLDHCGIADPAYDVGNFVASLRQHGIRTSPAGARAAEAPAATFVSAYTDRARPAAREAFLARVDFYVGVALVRKALRAFARHPLSEEPLRYVEEAHRGLDTRWGSDHANG